MSSAQGSTSAGSSSSPTSLPPPPPSSSPSPLSLSSLLLAHGLTAASLKLESVLSHTHDSIQHGVHTVLSRVEGKTEERQRGRAQVGKGKEKGSAIVLFCPSTSSNLQDLTTSLALSLASSHSPSTTAHTVLVLLTSADQLAPLLTAWAERKAAILAEERWKDLEEEEEEEEDDREGREKIPVGRWTFSSSDEKRGGAGRSVTPPAAVLMRGEEDADWERRGAPVPRRSNGRSGGEGEGEEFVDYISGFYLSHPWHFLAYMLPAPLRIGLGYGVRVSLDLADRLGLSGYEEKQRRAERQVDDELGQQERRGRDPDPHQQQVVAPLSSTTPPTTGGSYRSRTRSIAQDVVELGRDMMKGLRIGSTSPSMSWSGTFPLPSRSPERRHPHPSRSTTAMSVAGGEGSPVLAQGSKRGTEDEGRESSWGLHWEGGLSFHLSTPWWSTLNSSRRRRSSIPTEGTDKRGKGSRKERKKKRERAQIGAVIPIFIEGERAEEKARESIQAFCEAHHLLCRGLILVPSELDGKAFLSASPPPHLSAGDGRPYPQETMSTTAHALPLIRALLPQLRRDQGRIVALEMVEAEGLLLLGAATSTRKDKDKTSKKRAQGQMMMSREGVYRDAVAAQRRLSGIWMEVEKEVAREEKAYRSVELAAASSSAQRSDAALSTFRSQGEWSASWQELQAEEMGSVLARVGWVGKVAWQAGVERVVRRPVRRVRGFAGWLLDVWEAEVGGGVGAVQVCRVRVAPVMGSGGGNVLPNAPTSLLSIAYPDPSQPWPPAIRKLLATYLRARVKVVPASRQIIYYFAATGLEAASQQSQKRVLARHRRQEKGRDEVEGEEAEAGVHGGEGASTAPESSLRQRRRPEAEPLRPVRPGSEEQTATIQGGEDEDPVEGGDERQEESARRTTSVAAVLPPPPSPPLLTKLIRSAVEDEWARSGYCVGVGGRLEGLLPGWVKAVGGWVVYQVV